MKRREKILLAALVGTLVLWQGGAILNAFVFGPVEERQIDIAARNKRVVEKKVQLEESRNAAGKLKVWNKRSLPPDPVVATNLYQSWLIELATKKLSNAVVIPSPNLAVARRKGEAYSIISATIKGQGTLEKLCDFLYEFRRCGLLHRVTRMTLKTDQHQGDPVLDIDLSVEGLSLKDAPARTTLFSDTNLADLPEVRPARDRKTYSQLLAKNLFVRGYNGPPRPRDGDRGSPGSSLVPDEDPREFIYLVGSFSTGGSFDATVRDMSTDKTVRFDEGADFSFAGIEGKVLAIGIDFMILEIKGEAWRLELGDNLAHLKKVPPPAKAETGSVESAEAPDAG